MNFSDDFEENLNIIIKWLMIISLIAIIFWCLINFFNFIANSSDNEKNETESSVIKDDIILPSPDDISSQLLDENKIDDASMLLNEDEILSETKGNHVLKVNVKEMPSTLFFAMADNTAETLKKKREIINQTVGENYMDSVLSYGKLERWNPASFPLKVYIQAPKEVPPSHINEIKNAFTKWQDITGNFVSFTYVDSPEKADVLCTYPADFNRTCNADESSAMSKQYFTYDSSGNIEKSHIEMTYNDCNGVTYAEDLVYAFALREIGHSLGLRGHSGRFQNKTLYYPKANKNESVRPEISAADINTLKLIYSVIPDKTNVKFSDEQLMKLINPSDIWGDEIARSAKSEKAILYNIEHSPEIPELYIALANHYVDNGKYDEALSAYSRSIVMLNDAEFKARVYVRVGEAYSSQKRYLEAIEAYKLSLLSLNSKRNLFNVYFNLGNIYYLQEKYDDSLKSFQEAIQFVENKETFFKLLMNLSQVYVKVGDYSNAQKCADKAYSLYQTRDSRYMAAYTRYLENDYDAAEGLMNNAIAEDAALSDYALMAQIYYKTEQISKLRSLEKQAKIKYPQNPPFKFE